MKTVSIVLLFLLVVNICSISIIDRIYYANIQYFTKNFCINKSKPLLKCNGKCHLKKVIKNVNSSSKKSNFSINITLEFLGSNNFKSYLSFISVTKILHPKLTENLSKMNILIFPKPPQYIF